MIKFHICPKTKSTPLPGKPADFRIRPALTGSSDIPPHPPKVSAFFPKPASSRISTCSPDRGSSFHTARPAPLFHLTRQEVPTSRLTCQRFPHSSPSRQVPVFRLVPPTEDPHSTPPDQHLYSTLPVRKFRHPASPAKGFRILPRPNRFPYSAPAQNFRIAKKHPHPLRMEVFRLFKLPITQQQKYLLQLCIRPCVPTGCVFP